jgi:hypothetical protein
MATLSRPVARLLRAASFSILALGAAACEDAATDKKGPTTAADPGEQAKIDQAKKLIAQANDALADKSYGKARKHLKQAQELGVESLRFEIEEAMEKVDKRQAKLWAGEVTESFQNKDCAGAFKQLDEPLKTLAESEAFTRELRRLVGADALACLQSKVDEKVTAGAFADARALVSAAETKTVLGPTAWKKLNVELEGTILEALKGQIDGDLKARKWAQAVAKIEAAGKKGDANEEQVAALIAAVREGVGPEIAALAARAIGQNDAPATLKQLDQLVKTAHWEIAEPGMAGIGDKALPEELAGKREALAIWVEGVRGGMKPLKRGEPRWTHGKVPVHPASKIDAASKRDIPHGTQVWILGTAKNMALVTTTDPGTASLAQLLDKVTGWAALDRLSSANTADWLVPDDQLKGQRVWGPLRAPDPLYELGVVMEVAGRDITVQRLADGHNIKLTRGKLRSGRLAPGTKVLTFCTAKEQPAQVVELPVSARSAKLKCDGGQEKEEDLASLRSKPELLPPTR